MNIVADPDDRRTFSLLVDQYQRDLQRLCTLLLRDTHLAEDAVQETFLLAYKNFHKFRGESSIRTWLTRIAVNTCRSMQRRAWIRHEDRCVDLDTLPIAVPGMSETSIALMSEVLRLPPKEKETVWLYYYQEMSVREVAKMLGVTTSTVSKRLSKARDRLRETLGGMNDED